MQNDQPIEICFRYLDMGNPANRSLINEMDYLFEVAKFFGDVNDIPVFSRDELLSNMSKRLQTIKIDWTELTEGKMGNTPDTGQNEVTPCRFEKISGTRRSLVGFFVSNMLYIVRVEEMGDEKSESRKNVL